MVSATAASVAMRCDAIEIIWNKIPDSWSYFHIWLWSYLDWMAEKPLTSCSMLASVRRVSARARACVGVCDCERIRFICRYIYLHHFTRVGDNSRQKRLWNIVVSASQVASSQPSVSRVVKTRKRGCAAYYNYSLQHLFFAFNEFELYGCRHHFTRFPCSSRSMLSLMWKHRVSERDAWIQIRIYIQRHNRGNRFIIRCHLIQLMTSDEDSASIYSQTPPHPLNF